MLSNSARRHLNQFQKIFALNSQKNATLLNSALNIREDTVAVTVKQQVPCTAKNCLTNWHFGSKRTEANTLKVICIFSQRLCLALTLIQKRYATFLMVNRPTIYYSILQNWPEPISKEQTLSVKVCACLLLNCHLMNIEIFMENFSKNPKQSNY